MLTQHFKEEVEMAHLTFCRQLAEVLDNGADVLSIWIMPHEAFFHLDGYTKSKTSVTGLKGILCSCWNSLHIAMKLLM